MVGNTWNVEKIMCYKSSNEPNCHSYFKRHISENRVGSKRAMNDETRTHWTPNLRVQPFPVYQIKSLLIKIFCIINV